VTEFLALAGYPAASLLEVRKEQKGKYFFSCNCPRDFLYQ
jgi:hypothetical protein